jgi:nicotinate-nucleotide adenylyltransferase
MSNALGIFGGTFDPVHYGHLRAAAEVRDALDLMELRLVPARDPPHRGTPSATAAHRVEMLKLALAEFPQLAIDTREIDRIGKSYTVDTLRELRNEQPDRPLVLVVGADAFAGLPQWHRWRELPRLAHIAVVTRPGTRLEDALHGPLAELWQNRHRESKVQLETAPAGAILTVPVTPQPISATAIRAALAQGRKEIAQVRGLLPAAVLAYIDHHQLYRPPHIPSPDAS